ncbi:hypothetical protein OJ253_1682 [Cryptosporidium canis]|uniref:Uncharacterized protein n=1 Tax=Cryptosporidium canis TaxID=195482 RepID=A0A9D5DGK2_9CRYT|nr:hypothetical protein OJ253_1682 [Cryptosporidium canis]
MSCGRNAAFELPPNSLPRGGRRRSEAGMGRKKGNSPALLGEEQKHATESVLDSCGPDDLVDLPFVVPSRRIVIEWPVQLFGSQCPKLDVAEIEISSVFSCHQKSKEEQGFDSNKPSPGHCPEPQRAPPPERALSPEPHQLPVKLKLRHMQIYMMRGHACKYFYDKLKDIFSFNVHIKIERNQIIQTMYILERCSDSSSLEKCDSLQSPKRSNLGYTRFITSQIRQSRSNFHLNSQIFKVLVSKILNLKVSVRCNEAVHLELVNGSRSNLAKLPITRQSLLHLARYGGFQTLLELHDSPIPTSRDPHSSANAACLPTACIGYVLLSVQKG